MLESKSKDGSESKSDDRKRSAVAPRALSIPDAANYVGLSRAGIYNIIRAGGIPVRKIGARSIVLREDLDRFLEALPVVGVEAA